MRTYSVSFKIYYEDCLPLTQWMTQQCRRVWTVTLCIAQIPKLQKHPRPAVLYTTDFSVICVLSNLFSIWCMHSHALILYTCWPKHTLYTQQDPPDLNSFSVSLSLLHLALNMSWATCALHLHVGVQFLRISADRLPPLNSIDLLYGI